MAIKFKECPSCRSNGNGLPISECQRCGHVFCKRCAGKVQDDVFSYNAYCPSCSNKGSVIGRVQR